MKRVLVIVAILIGALTPMAPPRVLADSPDWESVPGPSGGAVAALAMSPNFANDLTVYAGLRGFGVYRSTDGGSTWQAAGLLDQVIVDLAISPNFAVDHTLFAATGVGSTGYQVYRSTDGGTTWQPPYVTPYNYGFKPLNGLSISPNFSSDHTVYVLGTAEMYKSADGGLVFTKMAGWYATHYVTALAFSPAFAVDHTLFAAVSDNGIMKSTDSGGAWLPTAFSASAYTALAVSPDYANDHTLAAIESSTGRLYISTDGAASRAERDLFLASGENHTLRFSPTFAADRLMLAASSGDPGAYRSSDGGATWTTAGWPDPVYPYRDSFAGGAIMALAIPPNTVPNNLALAGTRSSLYVSRDRGQTWSQNNTGLPRLTLRTVAAAPDNPARLVAGTSYFDQQHFNGASLIPSQGNLQLSENGGQSWRDVSGPLDQVRRVVFSPDATNDHTAFACVGIVGQDGYTGGGIYRSTDDARHWSALTGRVACSDLALSPDYSKDHTAWAYVAGQGLLLTTNGGDTWNGLSNDLAAEILLPSPNYTADQTLFAATSDARLLKSVDGGKHWTPILAYTITSLALSPAYGASQTLYAGVKETGSSAGAIYRSSDGGAHWLKLATGIPPLVNNQSALISTLKFAADGSIVAGVTYGDANGKVYRSTDGGQTWQAWAELSDSGLFEVLSLTNMADSDQRGAFTFIAGTAYALHGHVQQQRDTAEQGTWDTTGPRGGRGDLLAVSPNFVNDGFVFSGEVNTLRASEYGPGLFKSSDWAQTWRSVSQSVDPSFVMGGEAVHAYTFSPQFATDRLVFASTSRGLYKSMNGGETWQVMNGVYNGFPNGIRALALAPDYPASGSMIATGGWNTLVMSRDFGQTWSTLPVPMSGQAVYSPNFVVDHTIFAAGYDVFRSTDRGLNWTQVLTAAGTIVLSPQFGGDHTAFVAYTASAGVSKTIDSGVTWTPVLSDSVRLYISPQYQTDQTIFGLSNMGSSAYGANILYRSLNGGTTWITTTIGVSTTNVGALILSPAFNLDHLLYAVGTDGLYRSQDGGLSWSLVPYFEHQPISTLVFSPGWPAHPYLLVGTAQSVYRSTDGGSTWSRMSGIHSLSATPLALNSSQGQWLTGTGNGVYASADHGQTWSPFGTLSAYINDLAPSPAITTDHTLFVTTSCNGCAGMNIRRTTDDGATWQVVRSINGTGALAISPQYASDHTLFAIGGGVWRSSNSGDSWDSIGTWPPFVTPYVAIAVPPNYPAGDGTLFAAGPGFWRLPPGETAWQPAATGILSTTNIRALAVAPDYATSHTLLAASVEYPDVYPHSAVFRSEDGGVNWQRSDSGLPAAEWRGLAFSPNYAADHTIYAVSAQQLYRSLDSGHSWTPAAAPPDTVTLNRVAVGSAGEVLVTSDSGVWHYHAVTRDILINGEAEATGGWSLSTPGADYAIDLNFHAQRALRLGLARGSNIPLDSFAVQTVTIPPSATLAQLNLRLYPVSSETAIAVQNQLAVSGDAQYVSIKPAATGAASKTLLWLLSNAQLWQRYSFDLSSYAGQTIEIRVGVLNDGQGGQTGLYADSAALITLASDRYKIFLPIALK